VLRNILYERSKKIVASIEALMTSSRLPGKVLMKAINSKSMLKFIIEQGREAAIVSFIVFHMKGNRCFFRVLYSDSEMDEGQVLKVL